MMQLVDIIADSHAGVHTIACERPGSGWERPRCRRIRSWSCCASSRGLWDQEREASFRLGERLSTIRVASKQPDLCDGVITLTTGGITQTLFDAADPAGVACDDPHFGIHWAGDLDRDGRLDQLVTLSPKYSYFARRLLLSSATRSKALVGDVARSERFSR